MDNKNKRLLISQELFFAKTLAGNDKTRRDRALKKLHKWLYARTHDGSSGFSEEDHMRIWKGLFYCFWMSDKPLVQEEVAESISRLIHSVGEGDILFIKGFFVTMIREWNGIDQHRLDKFQMLIRRFLRQTFEWGRKTGWSDGASALSSVFEETILKPTGAQEGHSIGLLLHFSDVYMEELTKAVDEKGRPPDTGVVVQLLKPFVRLIARNDDPRIVNSIIETVFNYLMRQSDVGLDYEELRRKGWHRIREDKRKDHNDEEEDEGEDSDGAEVEEEGSEEEEVLTGPKDPRAGGVDVVLPQLDVDFEVISAMVFDEIKDPSLRPKLRRKVEDLARKLKSITRGRYPLQVGTIPSNLKWNREERRKAVKKAARDLLTHEEKLLEKEIDEEDIEDIPKKKQKLMNGTLPEEEKTKKGRKRKRGKRKNRSERRRTAKGNVENNEVSKVKSVGKRSVDEEEHIGVGDVSPPKKRHSICEGWEVGELKTAETTTKVRRSVQREEWVVQTCDEMSDKKRRKSPKMATPNAGDYETEVVIKALRPNPFSPYCPRVATPLLRRKELKTPVKSSTPSSDKKVKIVLSRNLSQGTQEYQKSLKASPAIPFDPAKVPAQGVLKATSSPILLNPFYRKNLRSWKVTT